MGGYLLLNIVGSSEFFISAKRRKLTEEFHIIRQSEDKCKETNSILDYNDGETDLICKISD